MFTYPTHRRFSRGPGGVRRSAGSLPRAVPGAAGAGAAAGGRVATGRGAAGAGAGSGAKCSPAQGQRRHLLASEWLNQVAAAGGPGVLGPRSGPLPPPSPPPPRPPRVSRGFAPHTRPTGSRRWQPRGAPLRVRAGTGRWGGARSLVRGRRVGGGAELGGGTELETSTLTPTPRHSPGCCRLPTGMRRRPKVPRRQKGAGHFPAPAPDPSSESPGLLLSWALPR